MINVIFNPVNKMYKFTKVELYANDKNEKQYLGTYKSSEDMFRISIDNLSYGKYIVKLIQYDINDNLIFESQQYDVLLKRPNYSGKPIVRPRG